MSEKEAVELALRREMLDLLEQEAGRWVRCTSGDNRFSCVGRIERLVRDAQAVELQTLSGGRWLTPIGVFLTIVVLGPGDQLALHAQLAENLMAVGRMVQ